MNRPLRRVSIAVLVLFLALLANLNYLQVVQAPSLRNASGNYRLVLEQYSHERGPILVDGKPVAYSVATNDKLKYLRTYSDGPLYAHITGYYSVIYGSTGIEHAENSVLSGSSDALFVRRLVDILTGRVPQGGSVTLTLNPAAQAAAAKGLGNRPGAVVAIDPSTGAILALVSHPSFDPNKLSSHDPTAIRAYYQTLLANPLTPLLDRAINQTYPPGSTFKLVTTAAALSSGRYLPDSKVPGPAALPLPGTDITLPNYDNRPCTAGSAETTLLTALERSCNATYGAVGMDLGAAALQAQAEKFGFNSSFDLPLATATSIFPSNLNAPQTAQSAIGQFDVTATPLQMAMVVAAIANRGVLMKPYLVSEVRGPDLTLLSRTQPSVLDTAVSPAVAAELTGMMVGVVTHGTGPNGAIPGVEVAGKTGTAQVGNGKKPHAWFVSFAPAQDAKVAVAVIVENGGGAPEVSGNQLAAPIARAVMEAVIGK